MKTLKFKTTIKCMGCVEQVTPYLNETAGENNWKVDVNNPERILTIEGNDSLLAATVIQAVKGAGYQAEQVN